MLKGGHGEVNRVRVCTGRAGVLDLNNDRLALPGNLDLLATVLGLGTGVTISTVVECSDEVVVRVRLATGAGVTVLSVICSAEIGVRKWCAADTKRVLTIRRCESRMKRESEKARVPGRRT